MKKVLLYLTTTILLIAKYLQMTQYITNYAMIIPVISLGTIGGILIVFISVKLLDFKWKYSVIVLSSLGILSISLWYIYTNAYLDFAWSMLLFTALFLAFYRFAHYEIKKFPAFSYTFMIIYILTESISIWRNDVYAPFFFGFLSFIVPMYFVGIKRVKE